MGGVVCPEEVSGISMEAGRRLWETDTGRGGGWLLCRLVEKLESEEAGTGIFAEPAGE